MSLFGKRRSMSELFFFENSAVFSRKKDAPNSSKILIFFDETLEIDVTLRDTSFFNVFFVEKYLFFEKKKTSQIFKRECLNSDETLRKVRES